MLSADPPPKRHILFPKAEVVCPLKGGGMDPPTLGIRHNEVSTQVNSIEREEYRHQR